MTLFSIEQLNEYFCPAVKKATLRVPEVALPSLSLILKTSPPKISSEFVTYVGDLVQGGQKFHNQAATGSMLL